MRKNRIIGFMIVALCGLLVLAYLNFKREPEKLRPMRMFSLQTLGMTFYLENEQFRNSIDKVGFVSFSRSEAMARKDEIGKELLYQFNIEPQIVSIQYFRANDEISLVCSTQYESAVMIGSNLSFTNFELH